MSISDRAHSWWRADTGVRARDGAGQRPHVGPARAMRQSCWRTAPSGALSRRPLRETRSTKAACAMGVLQAGENVFFAADGDVHFQAPGRVVVDPCLAGGSQSEPGAGAIQIYGGPSPTR